jgi:hypothetical protein
MRDFLLPENIIRQEFLKTISSEEEKIAEKRLYRTFFF